MFIFQISGTEVTLKTGITVQETTNAYELDSQQPILTGESKAESGEETIIEKVEMGPGDTGTDGAAKVSSMEKKPCHRESNQTLITTSSILVNKVSAPINYSLLIIIRKFDAFDAIAGF